MKTFEIEILDSELAHYATKYRVEAETEEEAKKLVLAGEVDSLDTETYDYSEFNLEVAQKYINGDIKFRTVEYCKPVQSDAELEAAKIQKEIEQLESKLKAKKNKLDFLKG